VSSDKPTLPTRVGHAEWGDNRFRGYSAGVELSGHETVTGLLVLAIAGRRLEENERLMLDDMATVTTVADPRIWPLKLVRVTSAYGGCLAAMAAATVSLEGAQVGHQTVGRAAEVLTHLREALLANTANHTFSGDLVLEDHCRRLLAEHGRLFGLGVAFRPRDERVDLLADRVAARGRNERPYWQLFGKVAAAFWRIKNVRPNMGLAAGAVCLDMGFTPDQIGPLVTALATPAYWANAFEGAEQMPACLQTLPESCVRYVGPASRVSPRAAVRR
jgi:hypothetical protein